MKWTRDCTDVYFNLPSDPKDIAFTTKAVRKVKKFDAKPFHSLRDQYSSLISLQLTNLYNDLRKKHGKEPKMLDFMPVRRPTSWADKVNHKRQRIADFFNRQPNQTIAGAIKHIGCSYQMVKKVYEDMHFQGRPDTFTYNNLKDQSSVEQLQETINSVDGSYLTIGDVRRLHPTFSKKFIRARLRRTGLRWRKMARKRKVEKTVNHSPKAVFEVISHIVQALSKPNTIIYYVDEMHLPLFQTSDYHWTKPETAEEMIYNRRPVPEGKLSAIAMCSLERFVAVQIFTKDITTNDFLYFVQEAMLKLGHRDQKVSILLDNATWHTSDHVIGSAVGKFFHFNVSRLYQSNAIETTFSFVRADFRKRRIVQTFEEEAYLVLEAFFSEKNEERFKGVARNHLRSLMQLLKTYEPKLGRRHAS